MLYGMGRVDTSGRVANGDIVEALSWRPGDKLEMILSQGADRYPRVPRRPFLRTAQAPHHHPGESHGDDCAIRPGDHVLLAAAPDYGIVIVYPLPVVDEMIARYHSAPSPQNQREHERQQPPGTAQ